MSQTCLTTDELAERIRYDARTIRSQLKDTGKLYFVKEYTDSRGPGGKYRINTIDVLILYRICTIFYSLFNRIQAILCVRKKGPQPADNSIRD